MPSAISTDMSIPKNIFSTFVFGILFHLVLLCLP